MTQAIFSCCLEEGKTFPFQLFLLDYRLSDIRIMRTCTLLKLLILSVFVRADPRSLAYTRKKVVDHILEGSPEIKLVSSTRLVNSQSPVTYKLSTVGSDSHFTVEAASAVNGCEGRPALSVRYSILACFWGFSVTNSSTSPRITVHFYRPDHHSSYINYVLHLYAPPETAEDQEHAGRYAVGIEPLALEELRLAEILHEVSVKSLKWLEDALKKGGIFYSSSLRKAVGKPMFVYLGPPVVMNNAHLNLWLNIDSSFGTEESVNQTILVQ